MDPLPIKRILSVLVLYALGSALVLHSAKPLISNQSGVREISSVSSDGVSLSSLESLIQTKNIISIETLLPQLPVSFMQDYTFVYNSRSLQDASPQNPRALVFGTTGRSVISFNGSPDQKGYSSLEAMEFDDTTKQFVFEEISFPAPGQTGTAQFSGHNPEKCLTCHGNPARPIYDNYPTWPGFYGVFKSITGGSKDDVNFRNFISNSLKIKNRYSLLSNLGIVNTGTDHQGNSIYEAIASVPAGNTYTLQLPNTDPADEVGSQADNLGKLLLWYNYERIQADLNRTPAYPQIKYALLGVLGKCLNYSGSDQDWIPSSLNNVMTKRGETFPNLTAETSQIVQNYLNQKNQRIQAWDPKENIGDPSETNWMGDVQKRFLPLRYILMSAGLDLLDWPMTLETSDSFGADQGNAEFLGALLFQDVVADVPEIDDSTLHTVLDFGSGPVGHGLSALSESACIALKTKSLATLSTFVPPITPVPTAASSDTTLARCIACHTGANPTGPAIPFDNFNLLKQALNAGTPTLLDKIETRIRARDSSRMPLGQPLTSDQILNLDQEFRSLSSSH